MSTTGDLMTQLSLRAGLAAGDFDYAALDHAIVGYSWTQGTIKQIAGAVLDAHDADLRPHDFKIQGLKRGAAAQGTIASGSFAQASPRYQLSVVNDLDLPRRIALTFADIAADQQPNTAVAQRPTAATASARELALDMSTLALGADQARQLVDRYHRRVWFGRETAEFALTRQALGLEPGDVWAALFDGQAVTMRLTGMTFGADGTIAAVWTGDDPVLASLAGAAGAPATGIVPAALFDPAPTTGAVLDLPLLADSHETPTPFVYLAAGPLDARPFPGADVSWSDTAEPGTFAQGWAAVASSAGAVTGTMSTILPPVPPWTIDYGSSAVVVLNAGTLVSSTEALVLGDRALNLALIGAELVQFITATLTAPRTYALTGLVRGARGTEQFIAAHAAAEKFVLMDLKIQRRTVGAGEIGDSDSYILTSVGFAPNPAAAQALLFTAAAHKPLSPVNGSATLAAGDWSIAATRRTRIGGATLNGQNVPLGEASESWEADVMAGATVKRTLTGTALPLSYTAAMQLADWGAAQTGLAVRLYQKNPTLSLRGFVLEITA